MTYFENTPHSLPENDLEEAGTDGMAISENALVDDLFGEWSP
jgi:hypothetical protein